MQERWRTQVAPRSARGPSLQLHDLRGALHALASHNDALCLTTLKLNVYFLGSIMIYRTCILSRVHASWTERRFSNARAIAFNYVCADNVEYLLASDLLWRCVSQLPSVEYSFMSWGPATIHTLLPNKMWWNFFFIKGAFSANLGHYRRTLESQIVFCSTPIGFY